MFTISMTSSETVQIVSVHSFPEENEEEGGGRDEEKEEEGGGEQRPCLLRVEQDEMVMPPLFISECIQFINQKWKKTVLLWNFILYNFLFAFTT